MSAWRNIESLPTHGAHSEISYKTGWMPRLISQSSLGAQVILFVLSFAGSIYNLLSFVWLPLFVESLLASSIVIVGTFCFLIVTPTSEICINQPHHHKTKTLTCAPSEDSDQAGYPPQSDQSLRCPQEEAFGSLSTHWAHSEDWSDWAMPWLICVFAGRTGHIIGFVMLRRKLIVHCGQWHDINSFRTY